MKSSFSVYRATAVLLLGIAVVAALYFGRPFFVPLFFAVILAMLLLPVSRKLERWGLGRISSSLIGVLLIVLFVAAFVGVIYAQAASFAKDWPQIQPKAEQALSSVQQWVQQQVGINPQQQIESAKAQLSTLSQSSGSSVANVLGGLTGFLTSFVLVLLYVFFLLWKREKYYDFFLKLATPDARPQIKDSLEQITEVSAQYVNGRLLSMAFLALFYCIGLSIVGLKNAILVSIIAVIPTLIPYVGAFIGATFPLATALVSGSPDMALPTAAILVAAQVIDNNIIEPLVMGAKLNLSPLATIIAVVLGELIWGVPGMILFEPLFAIIRIVCDHVPALNPYAFLMGDEIEEPAWIGQLKDFFGRLVGR